MYFQKYLILMLQEHNKTQKEIASSLDVDASLVSRWCSGDRPNTSPDNIKAVIALFAKTPTEKKKHLNFIFYTGSFE